MASTAPVTVGFVGLGDQGLPIAQRIQDSGWPLVVWARRPESVAPFAGTAATVAATLAELAAACDVVGVCVRSDDDVREVVLGPAGLEAGARPGTVVAIHSTVLPETCQEVAEGLAPAGVAVIDAPVSGGRAGARAGTLSVMVGGDADVYERIRPILECFGIPARLGPLGSGQVMKLLNNAMLMAHMTLALDVPDLARALGINPAVAEEVLLRGSGGSAAMRSAARLRTRTDLDRVRELLAKDLHHFEAVARTTSAGETIRRLAAAVLEHPGLHDPTG